VTWAERHEADIKDSKHPRPMGIHRCNLVPKNSRLKIFIRDQDLVRTPKKAHWKSWGRERA
jgi:hypothetical protein